MKLHLIQCPLSCDLWLVGAAFSRDLPGQSRLKTAPTIKNNKVSFPIRLAVFSGQRCRSYETTLKWHGLLMLRRPA